MKLLDVFTDKHSYIMEYASARWHLPVVKYKLSWHTRTSWFTECFLVFGAAAWWYGGERLKQPFAPISILKNPNLVCLCRREWSLCLWSEIQTSPTGCRGSYQSKQTSTCQLRLFSDHSHLVVVCGSDTAHRAFPLTRQKGLTEIWEMLMQPFRALCRHQRGLQSTLGDPLGVIGRVFWMEVQPSTAWDRI